MSYRAGLRSVMVGTLIVVVALVATGCDWTQFGFTSSGGRSSSDTGLTTASLPTLATTFTAPTGAAVYSSPAVASGVAYVTSDDGKLYAFNANGTTGCSGSPNTCPPLWTASVEPAGAIGASATVSSSPAVADGIVFVGSTNGTLEAFDATGRHQLQRRTQGVHARCGPPPPAVRSCRRPRWPATSSTSAPPTASSTPSIATGVTNCGGTPKCAPRCGPGPPPGPSTTRPPSRAAWPTSDHRRQALRLQRHGHQLRREPDGVHPAVDRGHRRPDHLLVAGRRWGARCSWVRPTASCRVRRGRIHRVRRRRPRCASRCGPPPPADRSWRRRRWPTTSSTSGRPTTSSTPWTAGA